MKKLVVIILLLPFLFGCSKKEEKQYPEVYEQEMNGELWKVTESHNCDEQLQLYFSKDSISVYFLCIDDISLKDEYGNYTSLKYYFGNIYETMDESVNKLISDMEVKDSYKDGESIFYKKENLILLKMNTLDGNHDVYFLPERHMEKIKKIVNIEN